MSTILLRKEHFEVRKAAEDLDYILIECEGQTTPVHITQLVQWLQTFFPEDSAPQGYLNLVAQHLALSRPNPGQPTADA